MHFEKSRDVDDFNSRKCCCVDRIVSECKGRLEIVRAENLSLPLPGGTENYERWGFSSFRRKLSITANVISFRSKDHLICLTMYIITIRLSRILLIPFKLYFFFPFLSFCFFKSSTMRFSIFFKNILYYCSMQ